MPAESAMGCVCSGRKTGLAVVAFTQDVKRVTEDMAATLQRSGHCFTAFYGEDEIGTLFQPG